MTTFLLIALEKFKEKRNPVGSYRPRYSILGVRALVRPSTCKHFLQKKTTMDSYYVAEMG